MFRVLNGQTESSLSLINHRNRTGYFTMKMSRFSTSRKTAMRKKEAMTSHEQAGIKEKSISPLWRKWVQGVRRLLENKIHWIDLGVSGVVAFCWLTHDSVLLAYLLPWQENIVLMLLDFILFLLGLQNGARRSSSSGLPIPSQVRIPFVTY